MRNSILQIRVLRRSSADSPYCGKSVRFGSRAGLEVRQPGTEAVVHRGGSKARCHQLRALRPCLSGRLFVAFLTVAVTEQQPKGEVEAIGFQPAVDDPNGRIELPELQVCH